ncbi:hypothetical protein [Pajaroellobacter abortibovis]|uniref:hypothetical protein n=1 Tax=Pajaroellobacter abortibovis TaxID=1882918 RepID=UPI0012EBE837|nr:hypothetical protein [Pajaroellobacter abortibovis]
MHCPPRLEKSTGSSQAIATFPKLGEAIRPLGAMIQDRQSAIVIDENITAPSSLSPLTSTEFRKH